MLDEGVRSVAEAAFSELDAGELRFALAEPAPPRPADGVWHTREIGAAAQQSSLARTTPPPAGVVPQRPGFQGTALLAGAASGLHAHRAAAHARRDAPRPRGRRSTAAAPPLLGLPAGQSLALLGERRGAREARRGGGPSPRRLDALRVRGGHGHDARDAPPHAGRRDRRGPRRPGQPVRADRRRGADRARPPTRPAAHGPGPRRRVAVRARRALARLRARA